MAVGVIVPVRTPAPYLEEALRSVLAEGPDEVVVVDDASPEPVSAPDGVRVLRLEERVGPSGARAAGAAELGSELVALADADDVWAPGKLAAQLAALEREPDAALCFGRALVVGPDGEPTGERWEELPAGRLEPERLGPLLFERNPIPTASVVLRRSALDAVGGFDGGPSLSAGTDWELWLRLVGAGFPFVCEPGAEIRYRRHPGGVTADVAALAEAGLAIHERHAALAADDEARRRVKAADLTGLARGRVRERRYGEARAALGQAAALEPPGARERLMRALLVVPVVRGVLGRRDPYRGG